MKLLAPQGAVYQAGTLSGNPLTMAAGHQTITALSQKGFFDRLARQTRQLARALEEVLNQQGIPAHVPSAGSMFSIFFQKRMPQNFRQITPQHAQCYKQFFWHMLSHGIYLPPSAYEAMFLSAKHHDRDLKRTVGAAARFHSKTMP